MFNRFDGKYGTFLTVILIIAIIAIIGLLAFFGYDMYRKFYTDGNASDVVDQFENTTKKETKGNTEVENSDTLGDYNPFGDLESMDSNGGGGSGGKKVVKQEDYIVVGTIKIAKTKVSYPILERVTVRSIEIAVATQYWPGIEQGAESVVNEVGNTVIIGHNYRNGLFFSNNKKLELGDKIQITDSTGRTINYVVYNKYETTATDSDYIGRDTGGKREISLSTCTDDGNSRLIIWAKEE